MALKPSNVTDFAHKASSVLSAIAAAVFALSTIPTPNTWLELLIYGSGALGLGGVFGSAKNK